MPDVPKLLPAEELAFLVHGSVMLDLGRIGEKVMLELQPTTDGLLRAIAQLAVESGYLETSRDERLFADRMRDALKAHIRDARDAGDDRRTVFPLGTRKSN